MNRNEKWFSVLVIVLLLNAVITGVFYTNLVENQIKITENQRQISMQLQAYENYLSIVTGEYLETPDTEIEFDIHLRAWVHDKDGNLKSFSEHAGTLTNLGKDFIERQISGTVNATEIGKYISLSNDAGAPAVGWTVLPNEIVANNMSRASGTYASTGVGTWTVTYIFTASGAQSVQLAGLNWDDDGKNHLLCADQIASASLIDDDTLTLEWALSVV